MKKDLNLIIIKVIGILVTLVNQIVYSKVIGIKSYGVFTLFNTWINIFCLIILLGYDQIILKHLGKLYLEKDYGRYKYIFFRGFKVIFFSSSIFLVLSMLLPDQILYKTILPSYTTRTTWMIIVIGSIVFTLYRLWSQIFITMQKTVFIYFTTEILTKVMTLVIIVILLFSLKDNENNIIIAITLANLLTLAIMCYFYKKYFSIEKDITIQEFSFGRDNLFLFFGGLNYFLITQIDKIFVGKVASVEVLGSYGLAVTLSQLIGFSTILYFKFIPQISYYISNNLFERLENEFDDVTFKSLVISIPFIIFMFFFSEDIFTFFGNEYVYASNILKILLIGQLLNYFTGPNGSLLVYGKYAKMDFYNSVFAVIINVFLSYLGYKLFGILGIAIGSAFAIGIVNIVKVVEVKIKYKIFPYKIKSLIISVIGLVCFSIPKFLYINVSNIIIYLAIKFIIGFLIYALIIFILFKVNKNLKLIKPI